MSLLYRVLWYICLPFGAIWHLLFIWRRPEFRQGFWQRYGWLPKADNSPLLIHASSVGEVNAIASLVQQLLLRSSDTIPILITTTTPTGRDRVNQLFAQQTAVTHAFLPFDLGISIRILLHRIKPRGILLVETELWPTLLRLSHQQHVPVWLINGRLSQRSAKRYKRFSRVTTSMLSALTYILVQDSDAARRFAYIGADRQRIKTMGSVKFDLQIPPPQLPDIAKTWRDEEDACWVAGSTREGEEAILLQAWAKMTHVNIGRWLINNQIKAQKRPINRLVSSACSNFASFIYYS